MPTSHTAGWPSGAPTAAQLKEFFAQVESGQVTKGRFQDFLRGDKQAGSGLLAGWERFYLKYFGLEVDLTGVEIPDDPGGFGRVLVIAEGLTLNRAFDACKAKFPAWRYKDDLDQGVPRNERVSAEPYAIRVRDRQEADEELADRSADWIAEHKLKTETLLERLVHELAYFDETGHHLDKQKITLCSGSRYSDGSVPSVDWDSVDRELSVGWGNPSDADPRRRARGVVSAA